MNDLKSRMAGERVTGTFIKLPSIQVIDMAAQAFDFVVVDREHSQLSQTDALAMIGHGHAIGLPVILRVPTLDPGEVNRALEAGAAGIQLSQVATAAEALALRDACEYAPDGTRSISLGHALANYGADSIEEYVKESRGRALVVVQIESVRTEDSYAEILAARPDVAFIGMADMTVDSGFDQQVLDSKLAEVKEATEQNGVVLGAIQMDHDPQVRYSMVSSDVTMLRRAMVDTAAGAAANDPDRGH